MSIQTNRKDINNQVGGGRCSLCGSAGTNRTTCPLKPNNKRANPCKHPDATKKVVTEQTEQTEQHKYRVYRLSVVNDTPYHEGIEYWVDTDLKELMKWVKQSWDWMNGRLSIEIIELGTKESLQDLTDDLVPEDSEDDFPEVDYSQYEIFTKSPGVDYYHCENDMCGTLYDHEIKTCSHCDSECIKLE